jgi:drug/metabolite transporter (DMT)-like permease
MLAPIAAILAGFFFALSDYFTRLALQKVNPASAVMVTNLVNVVIWWPVFLVLLPWSHLASIAVVPFIAAGLAGPFLARLAIFAGMQRIGISVSIPISNTQVVVAALGGVLFFQEHITPPAALGILVLLVGVSLLAVDPAAGNREGVKRRRDLLFPLLSAVLFGGSYSLRKVGLRIVPEIFLGLPIVSTTSFLALFLWAPITRQRLVFPTGPVLVPLIVGGGLLSAAQLFSIWAIQLGDLSVVIPLQSTSPLFAVGITALLLRRLERVTWLVWVGAVLVVIGGALVNL